MKANFQLLALAKLTKDYDKELMLQLKPKLFKGHASQLFSLIQKGFLDTGQIPNLKSLEATVVSKAPKDILPAVQGILKAISRSETKDVSIKEIIQGLNDEQLIGVVDSRIRDLATVASSRDVPGVRQMLSDMVGEISGSHIVPLTLEEAASQPDNSRILTTGLSELDEKVGGFSGLTIVGAGSGCVDKETEFLTPSGWKSIADYQSGDKVLQYNEDGSTEFVEPEDYINLPADKWYHLKTKYGIDQKLSPEHKVLYKSDKGNDCTISMEDLAKLEDFEVSFMTSYSLPKGESCKSLDGITFPYRTADKKEADDIQHALSCTSGMQARLTFDNGKYEVSGTSDSLTTFNTSDIKVSYPKDERKYCFTMPSGFFVIRRNGCVVVTGNCGKTAFLLQNAIEAYKKGNNVLFISLEISAKVVSQRIASNLTGIDFGRIVRDILTPEEEKEVKEAMRAFYDLPAEFRLFTNPITSIELTNVIVAQRAIYGIDLVFIDYLNLVDTTSGGNAAWVGLQSLARELHHIAISQGLVIISASQINQEKASKGDIPPTVTTRGSQELFFSATCVVYLEQASDGEFDDGVLLWLLKSRIAKTGAHLLSKDFSKMQFQYVMEVS